MKYLIIRLSALGDLVLITPVVEYLSKRGSVDILTYSDFADIFKDDPRVSRVWKMKRKPKLKDLKFISEILSQQGYSLVVDLQVKPITLLLTRLIKARTFAVNKYTLQRRLHVWFGMGINVGKIWENYLYQVARFLRDKVEVIKPKIYPPPTFIPFELPEKYVVLSPEASTGLKRWKFENFVKVAEHLKSRNMEVVWIGKENYPEVSVGLDLRGKTDIPQMIEIIKNSLLIVGNDSAPMHIATALNIPCIAIMGPTTRSLGFMDESNVIVEKELNCRPCSTNGGGRCWRGDRECMNIPPDKVVKIISGFAT